MSYGLKVRDAAGYVRVFEGSWLVRYHSTYTVTLSGGQSDTISISGLNPNTWAVVIMSSKGALYTYIETFTVSHGSIYIKASGDSRYTVTVNFKVLAG